VIGDFRSSALNSSTNAHNVGRKEAKASFRRSPVRVLFSSNFRTPSQLLVF